MISCILNIKMKWVKAGTSTQFKFRKWHHLTVMQPLKPEDDDTCDTSQYKNSSLHHCMSLHVTLTKYIYSSTVTVCATEAFFVTSYFHFATFWRQVSKFLFTKFIWKVSLWGNFRLHSASETNQCRLIINLPIVYDIYSLYFDLDIKYQMF